MKQEKIFVSGWDKIREHRPRWPDGQLMSEMDKRFLKLQSGEYSPNPDNMCLLDAAMLLRPSLFRPKKLGGLENLK